MCLFNDTTPHELCIRCLLNDNVNVQQRPNRVWYTQAHNSAERAVEFVSNNHGEKGGVKGGRREGQCLGQGLLACTHVWCMVLRVCALLTFIPSQGVLGKHKHTHPFSPTHNQQTDTGSSVRQRLRTTTTSRQRSKMAEGSQEGERVGLKVKSERQDTWGGGEKWKEKHW